MEFSKVSCRGSQTFQIGAGRTKESTSKEIKAHLLPSVHGQAGAGDAKLEEEDYEEDDHVLRVKRSRRQTSHE